MDAISCIEERQSVRKFLSKPIDRDLITKLVDLAGQIPSWKNAQPTRYAAIDSREILDRLAEEATPDFNSREPLNKWRRKRNSAKRDSRGVPN
ncbi:Nitroreductase family protein [Caprobacter fermentans]|uniref:Nitroreductase family protein n=1 Tax=Caproicibacter fermentans TaxID=2576756 RepID=A0A6N8I440_9FIRM|nr:nitroreductase family protein [Caproicibacter fermentans]MVB12802.1 Nitroreductase family protein [Caproicibacter fermentans]